MGRKNNAPQRRDQIVWAFYDCLASQGHEKVTIKVIATQANLPSGVIHYYFENKDEIVAVLAEAIVEKYSNLLDLQIAKAETTEQRIDSIIDFLVSIIIDRPLNRVFYNLIQMAFERDYLNEVMKKMLRNYRDQLTDVFVRAGFGRESSYLGAALVAVTEGFSVQLMVDPNAFAESEVRQMVAQAVKFRLSVLQSG
jgi:DNA-binding transcriptional regulator YbjK